MINREIEHLYRQALHNPATPPHLRRQIRRKLRLGWIMQVAFYATAVMAVGYLLYSAYVDYQRLVAR